MTSFAEVPQDKRRLAIEEAAARAGGILPVIVEKDYWVCWLLGRIFENSQWSSQLVFKGGTSLSKVFGVIDRFSEDIDLSVAPEALGFKEATLEGETSKGKRAKLFENLQEECASFVRARFGPDLEKTVAKKLGARRESGSWLTYKAGLGLHLLEDSYAHEGYRYGFGHFWPSAFGSSPDIPQHDPQKALQMARRVVDRLYDLARIHERSSSMPPS